MEAAVIVSSILVAFGIDALWDVRRELEAEQKLLVALEQDMVQNQRESARVLEMNSRSMAFYNALRESGPDDMGDLRADSAGMLLNGSFTFDASDGALRNRDLSVLRDERLLSALGDWSRQVANVQEGNRILTDAFWMLTLREADIAPDFFSGDESAVLRSLGVLRADHEFMALALAYQRRRATSVTNVRKVSATTDSILVMIRNQQR
jgi:hypothetical protein